MRFIPLQAKPNQTLSVVLNQQNCQITLRWLLDGLYLDLAINDKIIILGAGCRDRNRLVRHVYLGFQGELSFVDLQGKEDPQYTGLGSRWMLVYVEPSELA